jgi:hypothetical protein
MSTSERKGARTASRATYVLERSSDPVCRHYYLEDIRTREGRRVPLLFFDVYVGDYGDDKRRPNLFFVRLFPLPYGFPNQTYDFVGEGMRDEEVIGEAVDRYLAEHGELVQKVARRLMERGR